MALDKKIKLPRKFLEEYRKSIALRIIGSLVILAAAAVLCYFLDFSALKYPAMGGVMVMAVGLALSCLIFRLHAIAFKKSWSGKITDISATIKILPKANRGRPARKLVVTLTIDRGESKPYFFELFHENMNKENKYQTEAPYKVDDTLVFLRGLKYPLRYGVGDTSELLDVRFVCPYCGDINKSERDSCYHCGKTLVK